MDAGLIPVKSLRRAKSRLAPLLDAAARERLAGALLEDALTLAANVEFLSWWVVSEDARVLDRTVASGIGTIVDPGRGLNTAVSTAIAHLIDLGAASVTVIPVDVPLAERSDLEDLVDTGASSEVVLVPGGTGGTNGLHLAPPDVLMPSFGTASLGAHASAAAARGLRCTVLDLPHLTLDLDEPEDLDEFLAQEPDGETAAVVRELLAARRR